MKAVLAYIPVIHSGYLSFFNSQKGKDLFLIDNELKKEVPRLERDMRTLPVEKAVELISSLNIFTTVSVISPQTIKEDLAKYAFITMPDEDVTRVIAEKYLSDKTVEFIPTHLRWDMPSTLSKIDPEAEKNISKKEFDQQIMKEAYKEASKSADWWRQIGACIVKDGGIILKAHNNFMPTEYEGVLQGDPRINFDAGQGPEHYITAHAESSLIAEAAKRGIAIEGSSIYVTTFPCQKCACSIAQAGIKRIYFTDGYSILNATDVLKEYGVEVIRVLRD